MIGRDEHPTEPSAWADLPTPEQVRQWEAAVPGTFDRIMAEIERQQRHQRRLNWAEIAIGVFSRVCALTTVVVLALLAKHFADQGAATQGAAIVTAGTVSIVAVFVTGRLTQPPKGIASDAQLRTIR